jgi:hypothetical protein
MTKLDFSPENIGQLFQQAVDEAIEQHQFNNPTLRRSLYRELP